MDDLTRSWAIETLGQDWSFCKRCRQYQDHYLAWRGPHLGWFCRSCGQKWKQTWLRVTRQLLGLAPPNPYKDTS